MFVDRPELINIIIRLTNWELNLGRTNFVDHYTTDPKNQEEEKKKNDIIIIINIIYHVTRNTNKRTPWYIKVSNFIILYSCVII